MKVSRSNDSELSFVCAAYETHGLPFEELVPYQTFQFLPPMVVEVIIEPMGEFPAGLYSQTIR